MSIKNEEGRKQGGSVPPSFKPKNIIIIIIIIIHVFQTRLIVT